MDERQLIIDKFADFKELINGQHALVQFQLTTISIQTQKAEDKSNEIDKSMQKIVLALNQHINDSPTRLEVDEIKKELSELLFIKKYWKHFVISVACTVVAIFYQTRDVANDVAEDVTEVRTEMATDRANTTKIGKKTDVNEQMIDKMNINGAIDKSLND